MRRLNYLFLFALTALLCILIGCAPTVNPASYPNHRPSGWDIHAVLGDNYPTTQEVYPE